MTTIPEVRAAVEACPFCGSRAAMMGGNYVMCLGCDASSVIGETEDEAIAAWNRRAALTADTGMVKGSIEGTVKFMRSDASAPKVCICCEGPHIFGRYLDTPEPKHPAFKAMDWLLYDTILQHNENEGRRVRVTVELIAAAPAPAEGKSE